MIFIILGLLYITVKGSYGIPAALIEECRNRLDKGLIIDILDEFDCFLHRNIPENAEDDFRI